MSNITLPALAAPILTNESTVNPVVLININFAPLFVVAAAILTKLSTVFPLQSMTIPPPAKAILTNQSGVNDIMFSF